MTITLAHSVEGPPARTRRSTCWHAPALPSACPATTESTVPASRAATISRSPSSRPPKSPANSGRAASISASPARTWCARTSPTGRRKVEIDARLGFGQADVVVAVPDVWLDVETMADLDDVAADFRQRHGRRLRIATKYWRLTQQFFSQKHGIQVYRIVESLGATEGAPAAGSADVIVDITTTGSTLRANHLKILSRRRDPALAGLSRVALRTSAMRSDQAALDGIVSARRRRAADGHAAGEQRVLHAGRAASAASSHAFLVPGAVAPPGQAMLRDGIGSAKGTIFRSAGAAARRHRHFGNQRDAEAVRRPSAAASSGWSRRSWPASPAGRCRTPPAPGRAGNGLPPAASAAPAPGSRAAPAATRKPDRRRGTARKKRSSNSASRHQAGMVERQRGHEGVDAPGQRSPSTSDLRDGLAQFEPQARETRLSVRAAPAAADRARSVGIMPSRKRPSITSRPRRRGRLDLADVGQDALDARLQGHRLVGHRHRRGRRARTGGSRAAPPSRRSAPTAPAG